MQVREGIFQNTISSVYEVDIIVQRTLLTGSPLQCVKARILKHFCPPPPLLQRALSQLTQVLEVLLWYYRQRDNISALLTGETLFKITLVISVALEYYLGEKAKCF